MTVTVQQLQEKIQSLPPYGQITVKGADDKEHPIVDIITTTQDLYIQIEGDEIEIEDGDIEGDDE